MADEQPRSLQDAGPQQGTVSRSSLDGESHPDDNPQDVGELGGKMSAEASAADGPLAKVKKVAQEFDRDVSGEYERRDDGSAP